MLTPLKYRQWNRIKVPGLCAQVANISIDHFLINQPEFIKKLTGQTGPGSRTTGCYKAVIRNSRKRVKIIANPDNFVGEDSYKWFRRIVSARWITLGGVGVYKFLFCLENNSSVPKVLLDLGWIIWILLRWGNRVVNNAILENITDYCDIVWHESGKGNDNMVERLQRRATRIIYSSTVAELPTIEIITKLGWEPLNERREAHVLSLVKKCIRNNNVPTVSDKNSWHTQRQRLFSRSRASLFPSNVVYCDSVTKSCTPTLRGRENTKISQKFWLRL